MNGQKNLQLISTKYFDIIFPHESDVSAHLLAQNADSIYEEIATTFNLPETFRLPVVITPSQDQFNAYFSFSPYNHIVIYDTPTTEGMAVFSETLLSTFTHELTHAISMNCHDKSTRFIKKVLGSSYNLGALVFTMANCEGATVSQESVNGEGRLNCGFSTHMVKQAKIENTFPSYASVQGARDIYPYGTQSYIFGGEFAKYLRKTYGDAKYAQYWFKLCSWDDLTYDIVFRKTYGIKEKKAWRDFYEQLQVPQVCADPLENNFCTNFIKHKNGSYYTNLVSCQKGYAYTDEYKSCVYFNDKKLFDFSNISWISLSSDGRFLTIDYLDEARANPIYCTKIYDFKHKSFFKVKNTRILNSTVFKIADEYFFATTKLSGQFQNILIYKIDFDATGKIKDLMLQTTLENDFGTSIFSLKDGGNGKLYFIKKVALSWTICSFDVRTNELSSIALPYPDMQIRYLSVAFDKSAVAQGGTARPAVGLSQDSGTVVEGGTTRLIFSYTRQNCMPRFAFVTEGETTAEFEILQDDLSGGFYYPIQLEKDKTAYIAQFFQDRKILQVQNAALHFEKCTAPITRSAMPRQPALDNTAPNEPMAQDARQPALDNTAQTNDQSPRELATTTEAQSLQQNPRHSAQNDSAPDISVQKFSLWPYLLRGTLIPLSINQSCGVSQKGNLTAITMMPLGLTYTSTTPWTKPLFFLSTGYSFQTNSVSSSAIVIGGTTSSLCNYKLITQTEFDALGFKQNYETIKCTSVIPFSQSMNFNITQENSFFYGRETYYDDNFDFVFDNTPRLYVYNSTYTSISNAKRYGANYFESAGFELAAQYQAVLYNEYNFVSAPSHSLLQDIAFGLYGYIPHLVYGVSNTNFCYDLPATIKLAAFTSQDYFSELECALIFFGCEIQHSPNWLSFLYFNRFSIKGAYRAYFSNEQNSQSWQVAHLDKIYADIRTNNVSYYDEFALIFTLDATPNIGGLANSNARYTLTLELDYRVNPQPDNKNFAIKVAGITCYETDVVHHTSLSN